MASGCQDITQSLFAGVFGYAFNSNFDVDDASCS